VDDGSTDGTRDLLRGAADRLPFPVQVITHPKNRGLGAALRSGAPRTRGRAVVTYDADRAYPLEDVGPMTAAILDGTADVVTASPWHPDGDAATVAPSRVWVSRAASLLYRARLGRQASNLHTFTCGFRAFRRETLLASLPRRDGFVATAEVLVHALARGARVLERPASLRERTEGESKMRIAPTTLAHLGLLLRAGSPHEG
jgi:dolichol-phosphate mannosyltransferase